MTTFIHSFQAEWLKRKRTSATWLVAGGAFFIPAIMVMIQLTNRSSLGEPNLSPEFWHHYLLHSWQSMAIILLPMGIILVTSLMAQIEYRNNAWKQLHASPQSMTLIFFTKLCVIVVMMLAFLLLFNLGIYLSAMIPAWAVRSVPIPAAEFAWREYAIASGNFFVAALPVIAIQQLISLHFRNFLASVGIGLALIVASLFAISWKYGYLLPFTHCAIHYMYMSDPAKVSTILPMPALSLIYFVFFTAIAYLLYVTKRQKG